MNNDPQRKDPPGKSDPGPAEFPPAPRPAFNSQHQTSQHQTSREAPTCDEVAERALHVALNAIDVDSQNAPQRYLDETAVPGGGE